MQTAGYGIVYWLLMFLISSSIFYFLLLLLSVTLTNSKLISLFS